MDTKRHDVPTDSNRATWTRAQLLERAVNFTGVLALEQCEGSMGHMKTVVTYPLANLDRTAMANARLLSESDDHVTTFRFINGGRWSFRHYDEFNDPLFISLGAIACISEIDRGVSFIPQADGTCGSPVDFESHRRMFKLLASLHPEAPKIIQKLAQDRVVVRWSEMGLGGIRSIKTLFKEFSKGNDLIGRLAISSLNPFSPNPHEHGSEAEDIFFVESAQPDLLAGWRNQLYELRSRLSV